MMERFLQWFAIILGSPALWLAAFVRVYAPLRAKNLAQKYEKFRADFQPTHDALDAQFNHQDRVVNGIQWHYVDEGNPAGDVPTACPHVQLEWVTNASHFDNFDQPAPIADAINRFVHSPDR